MVNLCPALFAAALAAPLLAPPAMAEDRALVIGIDDYTALATPMVLDQAVGDARRFADFLSARAGFDPAAVTLLTDSNANADSILRAVIDELLGLTTPGDRIVLYFAGMGTTTTTSSGATVPALVAWDGGSLLGLVPADMFDEIFDLAADRSVTIVIDAGFSGGAASGGGTNSRNLPSTLGAPVDLAAFGAGADRQLWVAAEPSDLVWESADGGVFTSFLLEGMTGLADRDGDRIVTGDDLAAHIAARSDQWCAGNADCAPGGLTPHFSGNGAGPAFIPSHLLPQVQEPVATDPVPLTYEEMLGFVTELFAPSNRAGLELSAESAGPLHIGSQVSFAVSAQADGALMLFDIDTEGRFAQIFPSSLAPDEGGDIRAGERIVIPSGSSANGLPLRVTVTGPAGRGILLALFTEKEVGDLAAILPAGLSQAPLDAAGEHLFAISQALLARDTDPMTSLNWSAAFLPYEILP